MTEFLVRRNTVLEALRGTRREIHALWLQKDLASKYSQPILDAAGSRGVRARKVDKKELTAKTGDSRHQGVALEVGPYVYSDVPSMLAYAAEVREAPLLLVFDLLHGPQNIGSLLRTAEICGVHGVIFQDRRAPDVTPAVVEYSAGAVEHLLVAQVTNLVRAIENLKEAGVWVAGLDMNPEAQQLGQIDLDRPLALVVGHEGEGLRRLVGDRCDFLLALPMRGHVDSLNAAVAGSIALYAAWQARGFPGAR